MVDIRIGNDPAQAPAPPAPTKASAGARLGRGLAFQLAALALVAVSALAGTGLARLLRSPGESDGPKAAVAPGAPKAPEKKAEHFRGWPKPDLVLVLTGEQHGYLLPCGCSDPQVGGLERRYNFLQQLKKRGWNYVAVDLGDVPQQRGPVSLPNLQGLLKYRYAMEAMKRMDYVAVGLGEYEAHLTFDKVLGEWALNNLVPRVVIANLKDADTNFPLDGKQGQTALWKQATAGGIQVGVTSLVGPTVAGEIKALARADETMRFTPSVPAMNKVMAEMQANKIDVPVLLYQGPVSRDLKGPPTEAMACATAYPKIPVVLCLSMDDIPPAAPRVVNHAGGDRSLIVTVGHKGKFIGVLGVFRTGDPKQPFTFRYELVEMTEDFKTPKGAEAGHPILDLMDGYTRELKRDNYLNRVGQVPHLLQAMAPVPGAANKGGGNRPFFVGSEKCKRCHDVAYDIWKKTPHFHAYQTLVDNKGKRPKLREYDPECIVCHTVGFGYDSGFKDETKTPHLKNVGCESCHGPASIHVANPNNVVWHKRINPWKYAPAAQRKQLTDQFCQKCHDIDNDVTWINGGFNRKWPIIAHPTPRPPEE